MHLSILTPKTGFLSTAWSSHECKFFIVTLIARNGGTQGEEIFRLKKEKQKMYAQSYSKIKHFPPYGSF